MFTICEDVTLIRVDIAQGTQGRVDVYVNMCVCVCAFVINIGCSTARNTSIHTHTHTHTHIYRGRVVVGIS